jgi:hypothetical protein
LAPEFVAPSLVYVVYTSLVATTLPLGNPAQDAKMLRPKLCQ